MKKIFPRKSLTAKFYKLEKEKIKQIIIDQTQHNNQHKYYPNSTHTCQVSLDVQSDLDKQLQKHIMSFDDSKRRIFNENQKIFMKRLTERRVSEMIRHVNRIVRSFYKTFSFEHKILLSVGSCSDPDCHDNAICTYVSLLGKSMKVVIENKSVRTIVENFLSVLCNSNVVFKSCFEEGFDHTEYWLQRRD